MHVRMTWWLALEWWCPQPALMGICESTSVCETLELGARWTLLWWQQDQGDTRKKKAVHTRRNLKRLLTNQSAVFRWAVSHCSGSVCGPFSFCQEPFQSLNGRLLDAVQAGLVERGWQVAIFWMMEAGIVDLSAVELFGAEVEMLWVSLLPCGEFSTCGFFISSIGTARCSRCSWSLAEILAGHDSTLERYLFLCLMVFIEALCL